ncbi:MAG: hypothetical protein ACE5NG_04570 [bacterium]
MKRIKTFLIWATCTLLTLTIIPRLVLAQKPVIVMMHGFAGNISNFHDFTPNLQEELGKIGMGQVFNEFYLVYGMDADMNWNDGPDHNAEVLDNFLKEKNIKYRDIYFICHSMGGLIARRYTHWQEPAPDIKAVVMLGTPNGGVNSAIMHWVQSSGFPNSFNKPYPGKSHLYYFLGVGKKGGNAAEGFPNDGVVGKWSVTRFLDYSGRATVETKEYNVDHMGLLKSTDVARDVARFLKTVYEKTGKGCTPPTIAGNKVFWRGSDNRLWVYDINSKTRENLGGHRTLSQVSVSGKYVAFRGTDNKLWLYDMESNIAYWVMNKHYTIDAPALSHSRLAFRGTDNKLWYVDLDAEYETHLYGDWTQDAPSISGQRIVARGTNDKLWYFDVNKNYRAHLHNLLTKDSPVISGNLILLRGTDNKLWLCDLEDNSCIHLGKHWTSATPAIESERLERIAFRGTDDRLWYGHVLSPEGIYNYGGHKTITAPAISLGDDKTPIVAFWGTDGRLNIVWPETGRIEILNRDP